MSLRNSQLHSWKSILLFELRTLLRTGILPALLLIVLATGITAALLGKQVRATQLNTLDSISKDYAAAYEKLSQGFHADTSTPAGKSAYTAAAHPAVVDFRLHRTAVHPPAVFAGLAVGLSDRATYYVPVAVKQNFVPADESISNPLHLLAGAFDVSFLIIYLLPLAMICISYNLLGQEKEQGTFSLLLLQGSNMATILFLRLGLRYVILLCCVLIITACGILPATTLPWNEVMAWLLVSAAYLAVWTGIIWLILSWNKASALTLMTMLCTWIIVLIALPAFLLSRLTDGADDNMAAAASIQREIEWETWELPQRQLLDSFYSYYPAYRNAQAYDTSAGSTRRMIAYYDLVSRRAQRANASIKAAWEQDMALVHASCLYNPAVYAQVLLNSIAGTDLTDYIYFDRQVSLFRERWKQYFYTFHFNDRKFTINDYQSLPVYQPSRDPGRALLWMKGSCYLLSLAVGFLIAGTMLLSVTHRRYSI
ncbi:DUF3526 domain-containing protein [Chitinophaga rhizophila]|uniref:DUF3526 domain-containing protein n=1 Tax=Chitinophaga rhizophila TaxID=2866212 RepID=A0ABS7G5P8_9BACT|nr:DUF3526 domain-containing protein [Chitinophaga rhizophila]MBW8682957.1 DUF3526 domain-containing protein [Chitinophaga rhizophila]